MDIYGNYFNGGYTGYGADGRGGGYGSSYNSGWNQPSKEQGWGGIMLNLAPALLGAAATVYSAHETNKAAKANTDAMISAQENAQSRIAAEAAKVGPAAVKQDFAQIANQTRNTNKKRGIASTIYSNQKLLGASERQQYLGG